VATVGGVEGVAQRLLAEREQTLTQISALEAERGEIVAASELDNADDEHDPEGATIAFERERLTALIEAARGQLAAIGHAEQRLADGSYGICERCGQPIGEARLTARPTAARCVTCAAR
jgi:RNA polymerase-binding transcription factor DksA